jgi:EAL domain-containing protein (putative c-di-GMP-specific phosphodiesterase class I)
MSERYATIEPLANPLDGHASSIELLLDRFFRPSSKRADLSTTVDNRSRLELIRYAVDATGAAEINISTSEVTATAGECDTRVLDGPFLERISRVVHDESVLGFAGMQLEDAELQWLVVLPHRNSGLESALVLTNPAPIFLRTGEPIAVVLQFLWRQLPIADPMTAEAQTLALLRSKFGRLPNQMYQTCLTSYQELLSSLVMVFEPVMLLSERPEMVGIHGWEALARRDLTARKAPAEILGIADTWGDRFVIERDSVLAVKAISSYRQAHSRGPWKNDIPKPVSVNVSVRSLLSEDYEHALGQAISAAGLAPHMVTLEISEHDAIEPFPGEESWGDTPIAFFQNRLRELTNSLGVNFAVDDFGVGYATLDRISILKLTQIKVDRAILHHSMAKKEYELVVALAKEALHQGRSATPRIVVAEGVDSESPISLHDLHELGINHVQGYVTGGTAGPSLEPLSEGVRRKVAAATARNT